MDRKSFIKKTVGVAIAIPVYSIIGCSSSNDSEPNNPTGNLPDCLQNGATASSISSNHGHDLTVTRDDVEAGTEKTYSIEGSAGHVHNVTVTVAQFNSLKINNQISLNSTTGNGHSHSVIISCA